MLVSAPRTATFAALLALATAAGSAPDSVAAQAGPRLMLALAAASEAPPDTQLTWRAWTPAIAERGSALTPADTVGARAARLLDAEMLPGDPRHWFVVVEGASGGDAWFAASAVTAAPPGRDGSAAGRDVPRSPLIAVPSPAPARVDAGRVRVSWDPPASLPPALVGWQVLRISSGEAHLVGVVGATANAFVDEAPPGEHAYALRPIFPDGMTGERGRSTPLD